MDIHGKGSVIQSAIQDMLDLMLAKDKTSLNLELLTTSGERIVLQLSIISVEEVKKQ